MTTLHRLSGAAYGTHFSDQIANVSVPLIAALAFGASSQMIGVLVACQSMAHLLGSIPFGILIDQKDLRTLAALSAMTSFAGFAGAVFAILSGSVVWFGVAITVAGFGVVLFGLTALSILPRAVGAGNLARANAAVEIPRALCSFAVPLVVGLVVSEAPAWVMFAAACFGSLCAFGLSITLPRFDVIPKQQGSVLSQIFDGGRYALRHRLLLPISLCAIFWNLAFAALLVTLVPVIRDIYGFAPGTFGFALSALGLAAVFGSWLAGRILDRIAPSIILLFGPGSSVLAALGLTMIGPATSDIWLYACFLLLGFGPSMWLIAQNSVRQSVTPPAMLGRVNAVIQTAIYGVRPLGALAGGMVAGGFGAKAGLFVVVAAFAASFLVSVFSGLRSVKSYRSLKAH
ncbi:MFS transporter [Ascidiaceihabitans sp.]|uniref:MFS transporter n=1 Tax=Ascidiaceihabitans sp. TaxID=1872644 RepID=UPI0032982AAD